MDGVLLIHRMRVGGAPGDTEILTRYPRNLERDSADPLKKPTPLGPCLMRLSVEEPRHAIQFGILGLHAWSNQNHHRLSFRSEGS